MKKFKVCRNPEDFENEYVDFQFKTKYTLLLGPNGAGKTTIIKSLKRQFRNSDKYVFESIELFDKLNEAKHNTFTDLNNMLDRISQSFLSEGESIVTSMGVEMQRLGQLVTESMEQDKKIILGLDRVDSGLSPDRIQEVFDVLVWERLKEDVKYFIVTANSYELAHLFKDLDDTTIIWVPTMEEIELTTFEDYIKLYERH